MTELEHTLISVALLAIFFYVGKFWGFYSGQKQGIEVVLSFLSEEQIIEVINKIKEKL
jgi:hypothetical protein